MSRPANFNDLPVEERTRIIQEEITKIEEGKSHNTHTMKRIRNRRLEIHNLLNPDEQISYSEHESNVSGSSKRNVSGSKSMSNVSEHGSNVSEHGSNTSGSSKSNVSGSSKSNVSGSSKRNVSEHGSSSNVHSSDVSDVIVNASTGLAVFNKFLDDPEVPNYNKIDYFKERYLYLQNSKFF